MRHLPSFKTGSATLGVALLVGGSAAFGFGHHAHPHRPAPVHHSASPSPSSRPTTPAPVPSTPAPTPAPSQTTTAPPVTSSVMPDGVPVSEVGSLVLNDTGAQLYGAWGSGTWCGGGSVSVSGTDAVLNDAGACEDIQSPDTYGAGIYQATIYTANMSGHPAYWLTGLGAAWYTNGEIDAAEDLGGCWNVVYHADGPSNAYGPWCDVPTAGWHTVDVVRQLDGAVQVYYDGTLTDNISTTDMIDGAPAPLNIMFDTSGGNPLSVGSLTVWNVS